MFSNTIIVLAIKFSNLHRNLLTNTSQVQSLQYYHTVAFSTRQILDLKDTRDLIVFISVKVLKFKVTCITDST